MPYTIEKGRPADCQSRLQKEQDCYNLLDSLKIPYERIDHEAIYDMAGLDEVKDALGIHICKNLFLSNRQETNFYFLLMPATKVFKTKEISKQINSARLSFGTEEKLLEMLNLTPGSCSILSLQYDKENRVQLLIDKDLLADEYWGTHPCINTSTLKIRKEDILNVFLKHIHHEPIYVELKGE